MRLAEDLNRLPGPVRERVLAGARAHADQPGIYLRTALDALGRLPPEIEVQALLDRAEQMAGADAEAGLWFWRGAHDLSLQPRLRSTLKAFYRIGLALTRADDRRGREFLQFTPTLLHRLYDERLPSLALGFAETAPAEEALDGLRLFVDVMGAMKPPRAARSWSRLVLLAAGQSFEASKVLLGRLPELHQMLGPKNLRRWLAVGLRYHRHRPHGLAAFFAGQTRASRRAFEKLRPGLALEYILGPLTAYAVSHAGRILVLRGVPDPPPSPYAGRLDWTDPQTLVLPDRVADESHGRLIYRCLTAVKAAQRRFGGFDLPDGDLTAFTRTLADPGLARDLLAVFESARIERRLRDLYPGLAGQMEALAGLDRTHRPDAMALSPAGAVVELLDRLLRDEPLPQGLPPDVLALAEDLSSPARSQLYSDSADVTTSARLTRLAVDRLHRPQTAPQVSPLAAAAADGRDDGLFYGLRREDHQPEGESFGTMGRIAAHHHLAADLGDLAQELRKPDQPPLAAEPGPGTSYDEWDFRLAAYRAGHVRLAERTVKPTTDDWPQRTIDRRRSLVKRLRRQWQMVRPFRAEYLRRQIDGDQVDLDQYVLWRAEQRAGLGPESNFYASRRFRPRQVVSALLLDLSGSTAREIDPTGTQVIDVAKEGLLLFTEAISMAGDDFALFGYSGIGRREVDFYVIKDFSERYHPAVQGRIAALSPLAQNRDGAAIRHATRRLIERSARRRLLIVISDARPDDYEYEPQYAREDTRQAILEARLSHVYVFGLVVKKPKDRRRNLYHGLPHLTLSQVSALPRVLPNLYRRLTT